MQTLTAGEAFWLLISALLLLPAAFALCLKMPTLVALGFITILFAFSSSTWGQVQADNTIYARGTGLFYFSLLNILLWVAGAATLLRKLAPHRPAGSGSGSPFPVFFLCFLFLLAGHLVLGLMADQPLIVILGYNGFINVLNMLVFCLLLQAAFESEQDRHRLLLVMLGLAVMRALFGMVRFLWFGGDSANPYRNFENLDITLFYFDIADNFVAALAAFCIAWLLLMPQVRLSLFKRCVLLSLLALEIAAVALSFRRSSLIGLALMGGVLLWRLPWQRRLQCMAIGALALPVAAVAFLRQRLQFNSNGGSFLSSLLYDIGPNRTTEVSRFYELEAAAQSMDGNWLFGLGSWGRFYGNEDILDYHFGKFDFVHSGFGHLILKSGLAGLALFLALLTAFIVHYMRSRPALAGNNALLADAGFAGFLFWLPTLLVGTPVIEFRTMLLLGLTLCMPYMAQALQGRRNPTLSRSYAAA